MYTYYNFDNYVNIKLLLLLQVCMIRWLFLWAFLIYRSFISFTKLELITYILLKTFSKVIFLLRVIVSYILLKTSLEMIFLLGVIVFLIRIACFARSIYIKDIFIKSACTKSTYAEGASSIENTKIDLQSFQILEIKLFGT